MSDLVADGGSSDVPSVPPTEDASVTDPATALESVSDVALAASTEELSQVAETEVVADRADNIGSDETTDTDGGSPDGGTTDGGSPDGGTTDGGTTDETAAASSAMEATPAAAKRAVPPSAKTPPSRPGGSTRPPSKRYTPPKTIAQRKAEEAAAKAGGTKSDIAAASRAAAKSGAPAFVVKEQGRWVPWAMGTFLVTGVLMIVANYILPLPTMPSPWYLGGGLLLLVMGFMIATKLE